MWVYVFVCGCSREWCLERPGPLGQQCSPAFTSPFHNRRISSPTFQRIVFIAATVNEIVSSRIKKATTIKRGNYTGLEL
ncbi:unnamed protein product [Onchocerca flexuosa]|uniref:Secreted protein n=1 Tax=Onchocerca flexuosa TaxID=387005 RepID=A0A183H0H5_9BILA|nr:unnamed protein product [Onchocerca flexuosa]